MDKIQSIQILDRFYSQHDLKVVIHDLENQITNNQKNDITKFLSSDTIDLSLLDASLSIKAIVGQINTIIHAWGILVSLPYILDNDEIIEYVSLGAGSGKKDYDLMTSHRIAEFKFISWKGGPESIRKKNLFNNFYNLAENETPLKKYIYLLEKSQAMKAFTERSIENALKPRVWKSFKDKYGDKYEKVDEYYNDHRHLVEIVDLKTIVPEFFDTSVENK